MATTDDRSDPLAAGEAALARGAWQEARDLFEEACGVRKPDRPLQSGFGSRARQRTTRCAEPPFGAQVIPSPAICRAAEPTRDDSDLDND
jgi:hypothetical protein